MASLSYNDVFSGFYQRVEAYDLIGLPSQQATNLLMGWLKSAVNKPIVMNLFADIELDDEIMQITYDMEYPRGNSIDMYFVTEVLALGVAIEWLEPKVNSLLNISQVFGSSEEKFYAQSTHLGQLRELSKQLKQEQRQMIADRGYFHNIYIDGQGTI